MTVFKHYARYYDLLYNKKSYDNEANFVSSLLKEFSTKPITILELGCGTGRHAEYLANIGYQVHGIDLSPEMVKQAQERASALPRKLRNKLRFEAGDARSIRTGSVYDAVISLFHVVSYQKTNADLLSMFSTAASHLRGGPNGGIFIFDCWYGPGVLTDRPHVRTKRLSDEKIEVLRIAEPVMHPNENLVDVNYTVLITDRDNKITEKIREKHTMRYLFRPELELMLVQSGLELLTNKEWLSGRSLNFNTWLATFVAKKM